MKKKRKVKKKVIVLIILVIVLIVGIAFFLLFMNNKNDGESSKVVDNIPGYGYTLESDQPKIYKDLFKELVKVLKKDPVDEKAYAELISQMVVIDFYNLDNKVSKNDVGGIQFIKSNYVSNFVLEASDTVYKYVELNIYKDRDQDLPVVTSSSVLKLSNDTYSYKTIKDDNSYVVKVKIGYKKDLGYPTDVTVKLFHDNKKLVVYEMK